MVLLLVPVLAYSQQDTTGHAQIVSGYYNDSYNVPYARRFNVYYIGAGYKSKNTTAYGIINVNTLVNRTSDDSVLLRSHGIQYEFDFYQSLWKSANMWLNYAYSNDVGFPNHRLMGRIWQKLPHAFLVSGGFSYYRYASENKFFINYAAEKYFGNNWLEYRMFTFFDTPGTAFSYYLTYRRFFQDINYLQAYIGYGPSDDNMYDFTTLRVLHSYKTGVMYVTDIGKVVRARVGFNYTYENYNKEAWRSRYSVVVGFTFNIR